MTATSKTPRRVRTRTRTRGPPPAPTPIRTARGALSAAADDRFLAEFLESSLRVPDLTLPPRKRFQFPPPPPELPGVPVQALLSGESSPAALIAAAKSGAISVTGACDASEVRGLAEASEVLLAAPEEVKCDLQERWFGRRDRVGGETFCWPWPVSPDYDRALEAALPVGSAYRAFREKMDTVSSKMEDVAKSVIRVLSDEVKNAGGSTLSTDAPSVLRLMLYNIKMSKAFWNDSGNTDPPRSHALSIHLSGNDQRICLRNQGGSTVFSLPAGSMLITVGKQIQAWSCGEFKSAEGEILFEKTDEQDRLVTLELQYSPRDLLLSEVGQHARCIDRPSIVAFRDQILVALILLFLFYLFWN